MPLFALIAGVLAAVAVLTAVFITLVFPARRKI